MFSGISDFRPAVAQVLFDLSQYYLIGYEPPQSKKDLKTIRVNLKRKGLTVVTRGRR